ncbi:MAG TPA: hypothetical protein VMV56_09305 [Williamwhitmania sp.]|nr:hypothetical protein [Williamwhitmania sp.]
MKFSFSCKLLVAIAVVIWLGYAKLTGQDVKDVDGNIYTVVKIGNQEWIGKILLLLLLLLIAEG